MGERLVKFYRQAETLWGITAKIRLASLTRTPSTQAEAEPDTPQQVERFERAFATVREEFQKATAPASVPKPVEARGDERLRKYNQVYLDLMQQRALFLGDVEKTIARVCEAAAHTLVTQRVSVWFYDERRTSIRCVDLFDQKTGLHTAGVILYAKDFPPYFKALEHERTIAAHDAHTDPRTGVFSAPYLTPLGINSMLDVPIWAEGKMIGVVCHEHTGPKRTWNGDEENFAYLMSNFVALAIENRRRQSDSTGSR